MMHLHPRCLDRPLGPNFRSEMEKDVQYSTVGCRRTWGRRSQPTSFLFFTTPANLVPIFQSVFESRWLACSAHTVSDDAWRAGMRLKCFKPSKWSHFEVNNAAEEVVFTANAVWVWRVCSYSLGSFLFLDEIPAWPFFGKPFFGTRQYCSK